MVEQAANPASSAVTVFMLAIIAAGLVFGLLWSRESEAADPWDGWSAGDDGASDHGGGSCDGH